MINNKEKNQSWEYKGQEYMINWIEYSIDYSRLDETYHVNIEKIDISLYDDEIGDYVAFNPSLDLIVSLEMYIEEDIDWDDYQSIECDYFDGINF